MGRNSNKRNKATKYSCAAWSLEKLKEFHSTLQPGAKIAFEMSDNSSTWTKKTAVVGHPFATSEKSADLTYPLTLFGGNGRPSNVVINFGIPVVRYQFSNMHILQWPEEQSTESEDVESDVEEPTTPIPKRRRIDTVEVLSEEEEPPRRRQGLDQDEMYTAIGKVLAQVLAGRNDTKKEEKKFSIHDPLTWEVEFPALSAADEDHLRRKIRDAYVFPPGKVPSAAFNEAVENLMVWAHLKGDLQSSPQRLSPRLNTLGTTFATHLRRAYAQDLGLTAKEIAQSEIMEADPVIKKYHTILQKKEKSELFCERCKKHGHEIGSCRVQTKKRTTPKKAKVT